MNSQTDTSLKDALARRLVAETGSASEHADIGRLLGEAHAYRLSDRCASELANLIRVNPHNIESNLDLMRLPGQVTWIEYADGPRAAADVIPLPGAHHPTTAGALVCAINDGEADKLLIVTAWAFADGAAHHSYATGQMHLDHLSDLAYGARTMFSKTPDESLQRLLDSVIVGTPSGFSNEIKWHETSENPTDEARADAAISQRIASARNDVISEIPFVLAALLAISTSDVSISRESDEALWSVDLPAGDRWRWPWARRGFERRGKKDARILGYTGA